MKASGAIRSPSVERAFHSVDRHLFVGRFFSFDREGRPTVHEVDPSDPDPGTLEAVYRDVALAVSIDATGNLISTASEPTLVARMLERLDVQPGMSVLEVGTGTGYNAALLASLVGSEGRVTTVEIDPELAAGAGHALQSTGHSNVRVFCADGAAGVPAAAPYDRIVVTAGCADLSPAWLDQLSEGGRLLAPLRQAQQGDPLTRVFDAEGVWRGQMVGYATFVPMDGLMTASRHTLRPPSLHEVLTEPVWPDFDPASDAANFWYFLGIADARATGQQICLAEEDAFALVDGHKIVWAGGAHLRMAMDRLFAEWRELGKPSISEFRMTFVPLAETPRDVSQERAWSIRRIHYEQVLALS